MDKASLHFAFLAILWIAAVIIALVGVYYQLRARRYYRPPSLIARLSPVARFRLSNYAPEAAHWVARGRIAAVVFLCVVIAGLAMGRVGAIFKADGPEADSRYSASEGWLELPRRPHG